jgi:hypothetical protein
MKSRIILTAALTVLGLSQVKADPFSQTHTMNLTAQVNAYCTLGTAVTASLGSDYFTSTGSNSSTISVPVNNQGRPEAITAELTLANAVCTSPMRFVIRGTPFRLPGMPGGAASGFEEWIPYTFDLVIDGEDRSTSITGGETGGPFSNTVDSDGPLSGDIRFRFNSTPSAGPLATGTYTGTITIDMTAI